MFKEIRRKDRILEKEAALELLEKGEYGFLARAGADGYGYGIPLSYVKEADHLYFHCAPEGYKLECLRACPDVGFCVVGKTCGVPGQVATAYESVPAFGHARQRKRKAASGDVYRRIPSESRKSELQLRMESGFPQAGKLRGVRPFFPFLFSYL